ncbi:MAG TPA: DUF5317 family protein [Anaerolineae bacterium]
MIILVVLAISIVIAFGRGGRLGNLAHLNLRWRGVILAGFLIQVIIFSSFWQQRAETRALTNWAYILSLLVLLVALVYNFRLPGLSVITLGFFFNFIAIAFNGGYMPASPTAMQASGWPVLLPGQVMNNSIGMGPETILSFLGDIFAIPRGFIFSNVFSIGDVVIAIGAVILTQKALLSSTTPPAP